MSTSAENVLCLVHSENRDLLVYIPNPCPGTYAVPIIKRSFVCYRCLVFSPVLLKKKVTVLHCTTSLPQILFCCDTSTMVIKILYITQLFYLYLNGSCKYCTVYNFDITLIFTVFQLTLTLSAAFINSTMIQQYHAVECQ